MRHHPGVYKRNSKFVNDFGYIVYRMKSYFWKKPYETCCFFLPTDSRKQIAAQVLQHRKHLRQLVDNQYYARLIQ
jgi:hypothetical protein